MLLLKNVIIYIPHSLLHQRKSYRIDETYVLPSSLGAVVFVPAFWNGTEEAHGVFNFIFQRISEPESNSATMKTAYACVLAVRAHTNDHDLVSDA